MPRTIVIPDTKYTLLRVDRSPDGSRRISEYVDEDFVKVKVKEAWNIDRKSRHEVWCPELSVFSIIGFITSTGGVLIRDTVIGRGVDELIPADVRLRVFEVLTGIGVGSKFDSDGSVFKCLPEV